MYSEKLPSHLRSQHPNLPPSKAKSRSSGSFQRYFIHLQANANIYDFPFVVTERRPHMTIYASLYCTFSTCFYILYLIPDGVGT